MLARARCGRRLVQWVLLGTLALLAGCSRVEILYRQADWLLLRYVEGYVDLTDEQRTRLKGDIATLVRWHCRAQLPVIGGLLGDLNADVGAGRLTPERVRDYAERIEGLWDQVLDQAAPAAARLMADLNASQVSGLFQALEEGNVADARKVRRQAATIVAQEYAKQARTQLERWLGPLTAEQRRIVEDWARAFRPLGVMGLDYRRTWQAALRPLIEHHRGDPGQMLAMLKDAFTGMGRNQPPAYRERLATNRRITYTMASEVISGADADQRRHFHRFVAGLRTDLAAMRCD